MPSPNPVSRLRPTELRFQVQPGPYSSPTPHFRQVGADSAHLCRRFPWCTINWSQLKLSQLLGSGGFGSVFKGSYYERPVAVKKVKCRKSKLASRHSFWAELNAAHLSHENIVKVLAASACVPSDPDNDGYVGTIIMEFAGTATLHRIIYNHAEPLGVGASLGYSQDVASGLYFLHSQRIVHLDVKPANILLTDHGVCKIGDFGCSQKLESPLDSSSLGIAQARPLGGTYTHKAPELLRGEAVTPKADVYSFGITLWQMLTREPPYAGDRQHVLYAVVAYHLRPDLSGAVFRDTGVGRSCGALLGQCWEAEPTGRPSAKQLLGTVEELICPGRTSVPSLAGSSL
uniref:non-specific serine/threonine protein kinase n=1 Tax=Erpetoichthys calabaricus TaxID=27687 RepID=A0A8C4RVW0_ERPCA